MLGVRNSLDDVRSECRNAIRKSKNDINTDILASIGIEIGNYDFFYEAAVYDKDKNKVFVKNNSFNNLQQLKHIITHECYHVISTNNEKDISGFMDINDSKRFRGLNEGYTELLAMNTMPDDEHIVYIPQIVMATIITKMITKEKMDDYYFNNKPDELYNDLVNKLKNKDAVDNLLACLTVELKQNEESILGAMEFSTMALIIENNDLTYEDYNNYRNTLLVYNNVLTHDMFQDKFSSCKDVVKNLDRIYQRKEQTKMINELLENEVKEEGVKKHD